MNMDALQVRYVQKYVYVSSYYEKGKSTTNTCIWVMITSSNSRIFLEIFERSYCIIRYSGSYVSYMPSKAIGYVTKILLPLPVFLKTVRKAQ